MLYLNLTKGTLISILLDLTYFFCFGFYIMEALDIIDHFLSLKHYHPLASMKQHSPFFLALFLVTTYVLYVGLSSWNYLARSSHCRFLDQQEHLLCVFVCVWFRDTITVSTYSQWFLNPHSTSLLNCSNRIVLACFVSSSFSEVLFEFDGLPSG